MKKFDFKVGEYYLTNIPDVKYALILDTISSPGFPDIIYVRVFYNDGDVHLTKVSADGKFLLSLDGYCITSKCDVYGTPIMTLPSEYSLTIDDSCAIKGTFGDTKDQYLEDIKKTWFSNDQLSDMWNKYED